MAAEVSTTDRINIAQQVLAVQQVLLRAKGKNTTQKRRRAAVVSKPRSANDWTITTCVQPLLKTRSSANGSQVFGVVQDGGNMGRRTATEDLGYKASTGAGFVGAQQDPGEHR